jgi:predicted  nucleic acid-binding Zn-ribbon protein
LDKKSANPKQDTLDPAASAFEALRDEVADLRQSINQLSQNIQLIPTQDYRRTLAQILRAQDNMSGEIKELRSHPAINLTPEGFINKLEEIKDRSLERERKSLRDIEDTLRFNSNTIGNWVEQAREANRQNWWLVLASVLGFVLGGTLFWFLR